MELFEKEFEISDLYVDCFGRMKPSAILFLAQEVAGWHCVELGLDWDTLARRNLFWAVVRHKVEVNSLPRRGQTVTVRTWPMPTTRTAYPRAMEVLDEAGNLLLRTVSLWVLMDLQTRTMLLPGKSGVTVSGMVTGTELSAPRSLPAQAGENRQDHRVVFSDLDRNGHVNNTRYLDWAGDLLTADFHSGHTLREMTVCYMTESREGQTLQLQWGLADQILGVDALRDGERIFAARLHYEAV